MSQNVQPRPGKVMILLIQQKKKGQKWVKASVCIYTEIHDTYSFPQKEKQMHLKEYFTQKWHPNVVSNPYNYISSNEIQKLQVFMLLLCIQLKFKLKLKKMHHKMCYISTRTKCYLFTALKPHSQKHSDFLLRGVKFLANRGFNFALFLTQSFHIISEDLEL